METVVNTFHLKHLHLERFRNQPVFRYQDIKVLDKRLEKTDCVHTTLLLHFEHASEVDRFENEN